MNRLDAEYRDQKNGMIDYGHYRRVAAGLRNEARILFIKAAGRALMSYFRLPQKRWMRVQASSKSDVFVA